MKSIFLFLFCSISIVSLSQDTILLESLFIDIVEEGKYVYKYERKGKEVPFTGIAVDIGKNKNIVLSIEYLNGKPTGNSCAYNDKGMKISESSVSTEGYFDQRLIRWYESGNILLEGYYLDELEEGCWIYYYDKKEETKMSIGYYRKGEKHNIWQYWNEDGELTKKEVYYHGELTENHFPGEEGWFFEQKIDMSYLISGVS